MVLHLFTQRRNIQTNIYKILYVCAVTHILLDKEHDVLYGVSFLF